MGAANVVRVGPLRIAGMSGIWKGYDYRKTHHERLPFSYDNLSTVYHIREVDVHKLLQLRTQVDIGLSHDWPRGIENFGDKVELFRKKGHLRDDSDHGRLGSEAARQVLDYLCPAYWFSAHLHVKYVAAMAHNGASLRRLDPSPNEPIEWAFEAVPQSPPKAATVDGNASDEPEAPLPEAPLPEKPAPEKPSSTRIGLATGSLQSRMSAWHNFPTVARQSEQAAFQEYLAKMKESRASPPKPGPVHQVTWKNLDGEVREYETGGKKAKLDNTAAVQNDDEIDLDSSSGSSRASPVSKSDAADQTRKVSPIGADGAADARPSQSLLDRAVPQDVRAKLPGSFTRPPVSPTGTSHVKKAIPTAVTNRMTKFMALDKPHNRDSYIELVEVNPVSEAIDSSSSIDRPLRLQYDKEWLAITRAFADDLQLGGPPRPARRPMDNASSLRDLEEAKRWVETNVVQKGLLDVPSNFTPIAPFYDPNVSITNPQMPMEYPNNQTEDFCRLIGIRNKFALTEEERAARMKAAPRRPPGNDSQGGSGRPFHARGKRAGRGRGGRGPGKHHPKPGPGNKMTS